VCAAGATGRNDIIESVEFIRDPIELHIEEAFRPGEFIGDRECMAFVLGLEEVACEIRQFLTTEPLRAVALCETYLAGCHAKADELDDSSGSFGQFAQDLICLWIKARQAAEADRDHTAATLLAWIDDDPYAFCNGIEKEAAAAFDPRGLTAFELQVRVRFEAGSTEPASYPFRHWAAVLRAIYLAQRDIPAYVALTERSGLTPEDCLALARLLATTQMDNAMAWVERGRALDREGKFRSGAAYDLDRFHRELLVKLGRSDEALKEVWSAFQAHPSTHTYQDLMQFVPEGERIEWHQRAMNAAPKSDLRTLLELCVELGEVERLAELVRGAPDQRQQEVTHYATEPAAKTLEESYPELAARLWRAQGMRILDAKKSRYYDAALDNFERARDCYRRAGMGSEWDATVRRICVAHSRKTSFIGEFQALAAGIDRGAKLSFLERAKERWGKKYKP
jgi:hypothetical protein